MSNPREDLRQAIKAVAAEEFKRFPEMGEGDVTYYAHVISEALVEDVIKSAKVAAKISAAVVRSQRRPGG